MSRMAAGKDVVALDQPQQRLHPVGDGAGQHGRGSPCPGRHASRGVRRRPTGGQGAGVRFLRMEEGAAVFQVGSGTYDFVAGSHAR